MERERIIDTLRHHEADLHRQGVAHAALFGSIARGSAGPESDIDILIELDPDARLSVYDYVGLKEFIGDLFDRPVDVVNKQGLKSYLATSVLADLRYAF